MLVTLLVYLHCLRIMTNVCVGSVFSAYIPLSCKHCSILLGRLYRTTPRYLDELREMYTIDVDRLD